MKNPPPRILVIVILLGCVAAGGVIGLKFPNAAGAAFILWILRDLYKAYKPKLFPTPPSYVHRNAGRFCHICGADSAKKEPCDAGLHG